MNSRANNNGMLMQNSSSPKIQVGPEMIVTYDGLRSRVTSMETKDLGHFCHSPAPFRYFPPRIGVVLLVEKGTADRKDFFLPVSTCDGSDDATEASRSGKWEMLHSINDPRASPQFHPERTGEITEKESTGKVSELSQSGKFPEAKSPQGGGCGMKGLSQ